MKSGARRNARIDRPVIEKGEELEAVVFGPIKRPLNRSELQSALGPVVRAWLGAACRWDELAIGDYRFVVFAFSPTPKVQLYVQFWSEPMERGRLVLRVRAYEQLVVNFRAGKTLAVYLCRHAVGRRR